MENVDMASLRTIQYHTRRDGAIQMNQKALAVGKMNANELIPRKDVIAQKVILFLPRRNIQLAACNAGISKTTLSYPHA